MNYKRILLGGLLAGVVMNLMEMFVSGYLFGMDKQWKDGLAALGKTMPMTPGIMTTFLGLYFGLGIFCAWAYAAMRPRFGAGPATAIRTGVFVWILSALWPTIVNLAMDIYPARTLNTYLGVSLAEMLVGTLLAAWLYREATQIVVPTARSAGA